MRGRAYVDAIIDEHVYRALMMKNGMHPPAGSHDGDYKFVSVKLYTVLYTHCGIDAIKVLEGSTDRCGFEAYRCLSKAYDVYSSDSEVVFLNRILQIGE